MNFEEYLKPELLILIPVLYLVGLGLKRSKLPDRWIPTVLGAISVLISALWVASTSDFAEWGDVAYAGFLSLTQGILAAGASVYANQLYVQAKKKE